MCPANLTPEYLLAEKNYKAARDNEERLYWLEEMLAKIPKHKGTDHMQADLKRKISQLKQTIESKQKTRSGGHSGKIDKEGALQVILTGPANTGKSAFLTFYTSNETSAVTDYPFATETMTPGMARWENLNIQFVDTPSLKEGFTPFYVFNQFRIADEALLILAADENLEEQYELSKALLLSKSIKLSAGNKKYEADGIVNIPAAVLINKADLKNDIMIPGTLKNDFPGRLIFLSVMLAEKRDEIFKAIYTCSSRIRVYTKEQGKKPNMEHPFFVPGDTTVIRLAAMIHKDFVEKFKYATVWGGGFYDAQRIGKDEVLKDGVIIEYYLK
mgnify:CR=1 FL=1